MRARVPWVYLTVLASLCFSQAALGQELSPIRPPPPDTEGGMPLMKALSARQTSRVFLPDPLAVQTLSDLPWAASGVNRPESGKRTAPSAVNWQDTGIYVAMERGVFLYCASAGLATGVRALIDRPALKEALGLRDDQRIIVAQSVGRPGG